MRINTHFIAPDQNAAYLVVVHEDGFEPYAVDSADELYEAEAAIELFRAFAAERGSAARFTIEPLWTRWN